ncbi:MAG: MobQ family relaxase [Steroidobacteraceae bacterium]
MAIYHLSTKPVSRGLGRSATAAAAYRAGELVHDLTTDQVFDYSRKRGIEHTEIVLPTAAAKADINWARDRQALWNAAEIAEKRKDARVAREYEVALPHELTREQRVSLVQAFSTEIANRYGVVVDFAIHAPHRSGDERNHHAHILTTTRELTPTGLGAKASIEWSDTDRAKKNLSPSKVEVKAIRERWAVLTNEHLQERGIGVRVDHRSLQEQGIDRMPTSHLGPAVSAMERRGIETEVGKRISLEMASERLAQAAELGRIQRDREQVQRSILDLSGDLKAAHKERTAGQSSAAELSPGTTRPTANEVQAESRKRWLQERELAKQSDPPKSLEELRRQGREDWLTLRADMAKGLSPAPAKSTERSIEPQRQTTPASPADSNQELTIEQIKAQGRAALGNVKQELQAEQLREQQRKAGLEKERAQERSKGRGRGLGRGIGDD